MGTTAFHNATDRYSDWGMIGSGGTAHVYKVFDRELGISLAIKILKPELCSDQRQIQAMRQEVLISRALRHPNICPIHDLYEGSRGIGVIMDLLSGQDLKQWIADNRGRLLDTLPQRLIAFRRIAEALDIAHRRIIHRDLKPANIFLQGCDVTAPLIMDFGLSLQGSAGGSAFAGGTPKYMAPEQYADPAAVDARTDLFSLGVLAYELLTDGRLPASSLQHWRPSNPIPYVSAANIVPPSQFCAAIPAALDRLILLMVQSDQCARPTSSSDVCQALAQVVLDLSAPSSGPAREHDTIAISGGLRGVGLRRTAGPHKQRRRIALSPFQLATHPVTNAQYRAFVTTTGYRRPALIDHECFGRDDAPVVSVTWHDAAAYAKWAGGRLPTELEWDVAARADQDDLEYPWGAEACTATRANIDRLCDTTTAVHSYPAGRNAWGLWDMCGNVWEWCADPWEDRLLSRLGEGEADPLGRGDGTFRSIRGGSFDSLAPTGRCGFRTKEDAAECRVDIGFRVAFAEPAR